MKFLIKVIYERIPDKNYYNIYKHNIKQNIKHNITQ